jgi:hypothetical protein
MTEGINKDTYLKLNGKEAFNYAKSKLDSGEWTMDQFKKMCLYWTDYHTPMITEKDIKEVFGT